MAKLGESWQRWGKAGDEEKKPRRKERVGAKERKRVKTSGEEGDL